MVKEMNNLLRIGTAYLYSTGEKFQWPYSYCNIHSVQQYKQANAHKYYNDKKIQKYNDIKKYKKA